MRILTQLSIWWFEQLSDLAYNHLVSTNVPDEVAGRAMITQVLNMFPIECVARGYLTGSGLAEYKENGQAGRALSSPDKSDRKRDENNQELSEVDNLKWIQQLADWTSETPDSNEFLGSLKEDLGAAEVYVFTPKGKIVSLPAEATPIDFAYAVHTEVGHRTMGARVNGRLVPLDTKL